MILESAAFNMSANLENSAVATGLEMVSFHSNPKERQCQRITRRDKKAFLNDQCKEIEENNRMETLEISSTKLEIQREHFMQRWTQ